MKIGRRSLRAVWRRVSDGSNYRAVPQFFRVHRHPIRILFEEVFWPGSYPRAMMIRTPMGEVEVQLFSASDLSTLNLVFCRQDYYAPAHTKVVVDVGSNIGLSALFWLTRNDESFVYCFEPSPVSFGRLVANLRPFQTRYVVQRQAVSNFCGSARLGIDPSGVNTSLELKSSTSVTCQVVHINDILAEVIDRHGQVDVLKLDSEGHELRSLESITPEHWKRIGCVNVGCRGASGAIPKEFRRSEVGSAERYLRMGTELESTRTTLPAAAEAEGGRAGDTASGEIQHREGL